MTEKEKQSENDVLLASLLDRQTTIKQIDTVFGPNDTFEHIDKIGSDAKKYVKSLDIPVLRIALARIAEKNPSILMWLMNNFAENLLGWIYRRAPFYNEQTAQLPRWDRSHTHSTYFREHSTDDLFASIDASMQKHKIDPQTIIDIRQQAKNWMTPMQCEILTYVHPVFVDLLEEWYSREDLRT